MMDLKNFAAYVADHLFDDHPEMADSHSTEVKEITKNNGLKLTGIAITESGSHIAPQIYVNSGYELYINGDADLDDLVRGYYNTYINSRLPEDFSIDFFSDFEQLNDRLSMKLINAEKNASFLSEVPHYKLGDLAIIFQVLLNSNDLHGSASITVRNEHLKMWNVDAETIFNLAKKNAAEKHPIRIQTMFEVLSEMTGELPEEMMSMEEETQMMYVLSNEIKLNAASGIIFTDKLQEFAEKRGADLYILPSSIHEVLLIPDTGNTNMSVSDLTNMVKEVNATQLAPDEILSDNVYYYDRTEKKLMFAETKEVIEPIAC